MAVKATSHSYLILKNLQKKTLVAPSLECCNNLEKDEVLPNCIHIQQKTIIEQNKYWFVNYRENFNSISPFKHRANSEIFSFIPVKTGVGLHFVVVVIY